MITEEIRGRVPGRREHARLNDELNRDELRTDDKKMEHNAAGLWKILKAVKKNKTGRNWNAETQDNTKKYFLTLLIACK